MNFNFLTTLDTSEAATELSINAPLWDAFTLRQNLKGSPHGDTKCILLRGDFCRPFALGVTRTRTHLGAQLPACIALVNAALTGLPVVEVGMAMAVSLKPGGRVLPHPDEGEYAGHFDRMHIVVTKNPASWLLCGDELAYPEQGDLFFFNHHIMHSAGNDSDKERVHIIVDVKLKEPQWQFQQ